MTVRARSSSMPRASRANDKRAGEARVEVEVGHLVDRRAGPRAPAIAASMAGERHGSGRAAMVDGLLGGTGAPQVDPLVGRDAQRVGPLLGGHQHGGGHVHVHDGRHQLGVGRGHHPVGRRGGGDLVGLPGRREPGVLGLGGGHLGHRGQQPAEMVPVVGRRPAQVGPPGGVEEGEGEVGLVDAVGRLLPVDGQREGPGLRRRDTTRPDRPGGGGWPGPRPRPPGPGRARPRAMAAAASDTRRTGTDPPRPE